MSVWDFPDLDKDGKDPAHIIARIIAMELDGGRSALAAARHIVQLIEQGKIVVPHA